MTKYKALQIFENYQNWRRGAEIAQPSPTKLARRWIMSLNLQKNANV